MRGPHDASLSFTHHHHPPSTRLFPLLLPSTQCLATPRKFARAKQGSRFATIPAKPHASTRARTRSSGRRKVTAASATPDGWICTLAVRTHAQQALGSSFGIPTLANLERPSSPCSTPDGAKPPSTLTLLRTLSIGSRGAATGHHFK